MGLQDDIILGGFLLEAYNTSKMALFFLYVLLGKAKILKTILKITAFE